VDNVKRLRTERGLTLMGLSQAAGTTPSHLVFIESYGHMPKPDLRRRLAAALGVAESDLWPGLVVAQEAHGGAVAQGA
jgi:transcriptional regulator with XRE-family HTH domain